MDTHIREAISKATQAVVIGLASLFFVAYGCSRIADNFDGDWNQPKVIFQNTNVTNPDLASLENCQWLDRSLVVIDDRREAGFGYLVRGKYFKVRFDASENLSKDDSTNHVSVNNANGFYSAFPTSGPQLAPIPKDAKFLRKVQ